MAKLDKLRWASSLLFFFFGFATMWFGSMKWGLLTFALYLPVLLLQLPKSNFLRATGIWWGLFLVLQSVISPWFSDNYFLTLPPNFSKVFDVISGLPGISGVQSVTTDKHGFRITKTIDYEANDTLRIFAIGASTTEQIYLDDHGTWTHLLQELLDSKSPADVEVINTGLSGTRARHHLATLKKITRLNPDIVLFLVGINDWNFQIRTENRKIRQRIIEQFFFPYILRATLLGRTIQTTRFRIKKTMTERNQINREIELETGEMYEDLRGSLDREIVLDYEALAVSEPYTNSLKEISTICSEHAFECVFVSQPTGYSQEAGANFVRGFWMTPPHQEYTLTLEAMEKISKMYNQYLKNFAENEGHIFCDLAKDFEPSYEFFYDDCHFNENGAKRAALSLNLCLENLVGYADESDQE